MHITHSSFPFPLSLDQIPLHPLTGNQNQLPPPDPDSSTSADLESSAPDTEKLSEETEEDLKEESSSLDLDVFEKNLLEKTLRR